MEKMFWELEEELNAALSNIKHKAYYYCEYVKDFLDLGIPVVLTLKNDTEYYLFKSQNGYVSDDDEMTDSLLNVKCEYTDCLISEENGEHYLVLEEL